MKSTVEWGLLGVHHKEQHIVYIIQCRDGTLYTGYTTNLDKRVRMHTAGTGAKFTRGRGPFKVLFSLDYKSKSNALKAEIRIKRMSRVQKLGLSGINPL